MPGPTIKSKVFIGSEALAVDWTSDTTALADFVADTYTQVKFVETIGEIGEDADEIVGRTLDAGIVRYVGDRGPGSLELVVLRDALDPGQAAMVAASQSVAKYAVKIELNDTPEGDAPTPSFFYMLAAIASPKTSLGGSSDIAKRTFRIQPSQAAHVLEVLADTGDA